jgi:energy-coupling factor transporter ATP-binding protein EcfA2
MGTAQPSHPALSARVVANEHPASLRQLPVSYGAVDPRTQRRPKLSELSTNTLFLGTTGCGKSTALKLLMRSVLEPVDGRYAANFRALVFDAKTDLLPFFSGIGLSHEREVILTNPFDMRCAAWDVARDVTGYPDAVTLAELLVPPREHDHNPFWENAVREVVTTVIHGLNQPRSSHGRRPWTFPELIAVLDHREHRVAVMERTQHGREAAANYFDSNDERLSGNIEATLKACVSPHRLVAAAWKRAQASFSFREWARGGGVLLVGNHYAHEETTKRLNNMLLRFAIAALMERPGDSSEVTTWLFLDELRQAGRFPSFSTLLTQGRSKGLRTVITAQGLSTLRAAFPTAEVDEVLNNCGEKCLMQLGSPEDAEWAQRLFSTVKRIKVGKHESDDRTIKPSYTYNEVTESKLEPQAFFELASAQGTGRGLDAYYHAMGGVHSRTTTPGSVVRPLLEDVEQKGKATHAFVPRPEAHFEPPVLSPHEQHLLGLGGGDEPGEGASAPHSSDFRMPPLPAAR